MGMRLCSHEVNPCNWRAWKHDQCLQGLSGLHDGWQRLHQDQHRQGGGEPILPVGLVMCRAIREYHEATGFRVGFKPAGGIRTAKDAIAWLVLIKEELGDSWLNNKMFRIGASGLLLDIERQLFHWVTGRYAAAHELAMS